MLVIKTTLLFLLAVAARAEKKIELQDIEEDNLKSEKEKQSEQRGPSTASDSSQVLPFEFLKNGLFRYFESPLHQQQPQQQLQQQRYVQQYAVTEPPERSSIESPKPQYISPHKAPQQAMVGYLSNVPMQIYLVPQYYHEQPEQAVASHPGIQYAPTNPSRTQGYQPASDISQQTNYIEIPAYVTPTAKGIVPAHLQQYPGPVAYVGYQPTIAPAQATVSPVFAYHMPAVQYPTAVAAPPLLHKNQGLSSYYQQNTQYPETNDIEEGQENEIESPKQYLSHSEVSYSKPPTAFDQGKYPSESDYPRYYNSRTPIREEQKYGAPLELPPPNPLLLKSPPPHLSHIPKALPLYRPFNKPVYAGGNLIANAYTPRPSDAYGAPFKRRPTSLLDSYIPSGLQLEYLKRGYTKDPLQAYEALSTGRHFPQPSLHPRHYERGFLPNQMYHTAAGGVTYGHYKRTPKPEKTSKK